MDLSKEISELESWLRREKVSPEILMYQDTLLTRIIGNIETKQEELNSTVTETLDKQFENQIYQLDLDRIKYLVANYLRTRMFKIQNMALTIVYTDGAEMLSSQEMEFLRKFYILKTNHFKKCFLLKVPEEYRKIEEEKYSKTPITKVNWKKHVIVKALEDVGACRVHSESDKTVQLLKNDIAILPYDSIKDHMLAERADFI